MTGSTLAAAALVAAAVAVVRPPTGARSGRVVSRAPHGAQALPRRPRRGPARRSPGPDVASVLIEVAARLRAGSPAEEAWRRALAGRGIDSTAGWPHGSEPVTRGVPAQAPEARWASRGAGGPWGFREPQLVAVRAATRLARRSGAPLADVLERCAVGIAEAGRAESARRIALAGPASTARLLGWLPVGGLLLGWGMGADPLATLLDGGAGTAAALAGLGLVLLGRRWTAALVASARRPEGGVR